MQLILLRPRHIRAKSRKCCTRNTFERICVNVALATRLRDTLQVTIFLNSSDKKKVSSVDPNVSPLRKLPKGRHLQSSPWHLSSAPREKPRIKKLWVRRLLFFPSPLLPANFFSFFTFLSPFSTPVPLPSPTLQKKKRTTLTVKSFFF